MTQNNEDLEDEATQKIYQQIAIEFCKLHDNVYSCKDQLDGVIEWSQSRDEFIKLLKKDYKY